MCYTNALLYSARKVASIALPAEQERHTALKSMRNNTVDNKTCNLNFSITFDLSDESREGSPPYSNSAELRSRLSSKRLTVADKFRIGRLFISLSHPYTFYILLTRDIKNRAFCFKWQCPFLHFQSEMLDPPF